MSLIFFFPAFLWHLFIFNMCFWGRNILARRRLLNEPFFISFDDPQPGHLCFFSSSFIIASWFNVSCCRNPFMLGCSAKHTWRVSWRTLCPYRPVWTKRCDWHLYISGIDDISVGGFLTAWMMSTTTLLELFTEYVYLWLYLINATDLWRPD